MRIGLFLLGLALLFTSPAVAVEETKTTGPVKVVQDGGRCYLAHDYQDEYYPDTDTNTHNERRDEMKVKGQLGFDYYLNPEFYVAPRISYRFFDSSGFDKDYLEVIIQGVWKFGNYKEK